jgi:hypothetical protein
MKPKLTGAVGCFRSATVSLVLLLGTGAAAPAPFVPTDDAQVLERLPAIPAAQLVQLKSLQAAAARARTDPERAVALAMAYYRASRLEGDPRFLGYAQAALAPWWKDGEAPTGILLLRATILQSGHAFDAAIADLHKVSQREPNNAQARLTRATILTVQGKFMPARDDCDGLVGIAQEIYRVICLAAIDSMTGKAGPAYQALQRALASSFRIDSAARIWAETLLGEIAHRRLDPAAERHFREALDIGDKDLYLLGAYCDWLLDQGRAAEVIALLRDETRADTLLLRLALAQRALDRPEAAASIEMLGARFDASRLRGDTVHDRENARFELRLKGDARSALRYALANWQVQREAADLRILAEVATAAKDADALATVGQWLTDTGLEFPAVDTMTRQGGAP